MMQQSDLVERLRAEGCKNGGQGAYAWFARELCSEAADEIERLRATTNDAPVESYDERNELIRNILNAHGIGYSERIEIADDISSKLAALSSPSGEPVVGENIMIGDFIAEWEEAVAGVCMDADTAQALAQAFKRMMAGSAEELWLLIDADTEISTETTQRIYELKKKLSKPTPTDTATTAPLMDFKPNLGAATPEPSLRQIIFTYYSHHFPVIKSGELTDRYIAEIQSATPTAAVDREAVGAVFTKYGMSLSCLTPDEQESFSRDIASLLTKIPDGYVMVPRRSIEGLEKTRLEMVERGVSGWPNAILVVTELLDASPKDYPHD